MPLPHTFNLPSVPFLQKYVQDILQEHLAGSVYKALKEQGGHVYVCGDVTMAGDVLKTIQSIVRHQGKLAAEEASAFISKLRVSCRVSYSYLPCDNFLIFVL